MPALLMTAAEIAAAEALAAEILVAQQAAAATAAAAAEAVQVANAAQAAQVAQAAQAAQTGQAAQTLSAAQAGGYGGVNSVGTATNSGIQALAQEVGTNTATTGIQTLTPASELEQIRQAASGAPNLVDTSVKIADVASSSPVNLELANTATTVEPFVQPPPQPAPTLYGSASPTVEPFVQPPPQPAPTLYGSAQPPAPPSMGPNPLPDITAPIAEAPSLGGEGTGYRGNPIQVGTQSNATAYTPEELKIMHGQGSGLEGLLDKGMAYAEKHPITTGLGVMSAYNMLNQPEPYKREKYKSTFDSSTYKPYEPTPPDPYRPQYPQYAQGGLADLGGYADYAHGGRMLKGPGDGMSDDIPATIANKQPARLANEEFVVPADVVSHLGNGSSEAGAKALYKMMDRVRQARTGNKKQGKQINPEKFLA